MRKKRSRRAHSQPPRPVVRVDERPARVPLLLYPGAYSWPQDVRRLPCSGSGGPHPLLKFCMVLFCGLTLLSACTGTLRQRPEDANLRYLADAEEMMPIPYTPRDDGLPLSSAELHAFKTVSDLDRHLNEEEARIVELHFKNYLHQMRNSFDVNLRRSARFMPYVKQVFASRGIPDDIAYLYMVESGGNPVALSRAGAAGLWQFMPRTGKVYGLQQDNWMDERRDPYKATVAAADYLQKLHRDFCNWHLAVAAYNAGEGKIGRALSGTGASGFFDLCRLDAQLEARARLRDETRDYVPRLIAVAKIMRNLDRLGLNRPSEQLAWNLVPMSVPPLTDLEALADRVGLGWETFSAMNPAYLRAASPPQQTIAYVPPDKLADAVRWAGSPQARINPGWKEHVVGKGDTLTALAKRNSVSVEAIKRTNRIASAPRRGSVIFIPGQEPEAPMVAKGPAVHRGEVVLSSVAPMPAPSRTIPTGPQEGHGPAARPRGIVPTRSFFASPIEKHVASTRTAPLVVAAVEAAPAPAMEAAPVVLLETEVREPTAAPSPAPSVDKARPVQVREKPVVASVKAVNQPKAAKQAKAVSQAKAKPTYYRVQQGDTMYGLAHKWGTSVAGIQAANKMDKKQTTVKIGQKLVIPRDEGELSSASPQTGKAGATATASRPKNVAALSPVKAEAQPAAASRTREKAASTQAAGQSRPAAQAGQSADAAYADVGDEPYFSEQELVLGSYLHTDGRSAPVAYQPSAAASAKNAVRGGQPATYGPASRPAGQGAGATGRPITYSGPRNEYAPTGYAISESALQPSDPDFDEPQVFRNIYVRQGQSIEDVARANGVSVRTLREANRLGIHDKVEAGQRLVLPQI